MSGICVSDAEKMTLESIFTEKTLHNPQPCKEAEQPNLLSPSHFFFEVINRNYLNMGISRHFLATKQVLSSARYYIVLYFLLFFPCNVHLCVFEHCSNLIGRNVL